MMRSIQRTLATFAFAALAAVFPGDVAAGGLDGLEATDSEGPAVQIINDHGRHLRVYLVDHEGRAHWLKTVDAGVQSISLPENLIGDGPVQIKVEPIRAEPAIGVRGDDGMAVRTESLTLSPEAEVYMFIERDLAGSSVYVAAG